MISTDPKAGTELKPGATVTVVVSKGRAPITVPDLVGKNINEARSILQQLGLAAVETYKDSDQPARQVIGQTPKAGTGVEKDAEVKLDVSKGPPQVTVPRVVDLPCQQAQAAVGGPRACGSASTFNPNGDRPEPEPRREHPGAAADRGRHPVLL